MLRLPFVYGDGDPHIAEVVPLMRHFPAAQRLALGHHVDIAQAVALLLEAPSPAHRIYNVVDDEAPKLAALFASLGEPPPDGSDSERARAFEALLDGRRIREDLGFQPRFPRLADALAAGAWRHARPRIALSWRAHRVSYACQTGATAVAPLPSGS
ncbi:MAG TPA: hypothetical protein VFS67_30230 [Polyangiaceae bacterium]|nr:hypothetical protein [Polyangiaceae bacterium]